MTDSAFPLDILVVDDDTDNLEQLKQLLPDRINECPTYWAYEQDFDVALDKLRVRRYDLLVSDIYRDRQSPHKTVQEGDIRARGLVDEIRERRFCPVVLFTDGQVPESLVSDPFVKLVDKAGTDFLDKLTSCIDEMLGTGIPSLARKLHDELDRFGGSYVWGFLADHWDELREKFQDDVEILERIFRRRAAIQLSRVETEAEAEKPVERETVDAADYYIYPPIGRSYRLGEIIRHNETDEFRVILTPHCFLATQPGNDAPRAEHVLTARTVPAEQLIHEKPWPKDQAKILQALRRRAALPASEIGSPDGRYCFLPGFMDIPDLYCDLMKLESCTYQEIREHYTRIAVLDIPFAEALQACMSRLYAAVGLPALNPERLAYLRPSDQSDGT